MASGSYHGHGRRDRMYNLRTYSNPCAGRRNSNDYNYDSSTEYGSAHGYSN